MKNSNSVNVFSIGDQIEAMAKDYDLVVSDIYTKIAEALESAYIKEVNPDNKLVVEIDQNHGVLTLWEPKTVVAKVKDKSLEIDLLTAKKLAFKPKIGDIINTPFSLIHYQRFAINKVRQTMKHFINLSLSQKIYDRYYPQIGTILMGTVENIEYSYYSIFLNDKTSGFIQRDEQIPHERILNGQKIKVLVKNVHQNHQWGQIECSRRDNAFLEQLFRLEVPEIVSNIITIKTIVREAGIRAKVALECHDSHIEPVGTCIGQSGTRIKAVSRELNGEKIDIFLWDDNWEKLMINAFNPAKVIHYEVDETNKTVLVIVHGDQYPNAIGRLGSAVRLISQLINYHVEVKRIEDFAETQTEILLNGNLSYEQLQRIDLDPAILKKCVSLTGGETIQQ